MPPSADTHDPTPRELADLSALADGTLDPGRRDQVEARIAGSPELSALYERERRAVELLHAADATDRAPTRLRAKIAAQRPSAATRARRRLACGASLTAALAAVVLALVLILPVGSPGGPSVSDAAALALLPASARGPAPDPDNPKARLGADEEGVYFPNWQRFDFTTVGQRLDRIGGREATTVFYKWDGRTIAYTIVGAPALRQPVARLSVVRGAELRTLQLHRRTVVTWRRKDHTCVLSGGAGVPPRLLQLAASSS